MTNAKLTIITVSFGELVSTRKTLQSVLQLDNKYSNLELSIIIVNGNPEVPFVDMLKDFEELDIIYHEGRDSGTYDAMNIGISYIGNDGYCCFINSDDEILDVPKSFFVSDCDAFFSDVLSFDEPSGLLEIFRVMVPIKIGYDSFFNFRIHHQGFFVRNIVLKNLAYDLKVGVRADLLLMFEALINFRIEVCNHVVARITTGGQSDIYSLENFKSFLRVSKYLNIPTLLLCFFSIPFVIKYFFKGFIGKSGLTLFRKMKKGIFKKCG